MITNNVIKYHKQMTLKFDELYNFTHFDPENHILNKIPS